MSVFLSHFANPDMEKDVYVSSVSTSGRACWQWYKEGGLLLFLIKINPVTYVPELVVVKRNNVLQMYSQTSGKIYETWA